LATKTVLVIAMIKWLQRQRGGDGSANIQAQVVKFGIGYEDAKNIAMDVFDQNFHKLAAQAQLLAFERAEEFTLNYLSQMHEREPLAVENISDPGIQSDILAAQSGYAKTGDEDLGQILVDILVDRTKRTRRNITSLCLSEGLSVAQKLTSEHFAILSAIFIIKNVTLGQVSDSDVLYARLHEVLNPISADLSRATITDVQYLAGVGCLTLSMGSTNSFNIMRETYPGIFSKGVEGADIPNLAELRAANLVIPCLRDDEKFQVHALNVESLKEAGGLAGFTDSLDQLNNLLKTNLMSGFEINSEVSDSAPLVAEVVAKFTSLRLDHATNTAIGTAIGHANIRRGTVGAFGAEIEVWLS
jgi:hypothetical protein